MIYIIFLQKSPCRELLGVVCEAWRPVGSCSLAELEMTGVWQQQLREAVTGRQGSRGG